MKFVYRKEEISRENSPENPERKKNELPDSQAKRGWKGRLDLPYCSELELLLLFRNVSLFSWTAEPAVSLCSAGLVPFGENLELPTQPGVLIPWQGALVPGSCAAALGSPGSAGSHCWHGWAAGEVTKPGCPTPMGVMRTERAGGHQWPCWQQRGGCRGTESARATAGAAGLCRRAAPRAAAPLCSGKRHGCPRSSWVTITWCQAEGLLQQLMPPAQAARCWDPVEVLAAASPAALAELAWGLLCSWTRALPGRFIPFAFRMRVLVLKSRRPWLKAEGDTGDTGQGPASAACSLLVAGAWT